MSGLFGSNAKTAAKTPTRAFGVSLQSSVYGKPVAIVYGTTRASGNMLLYGNFTAQLVNQGQTSGKGGMFAPTNAGSQTYQYSAAFAFALCEGPIQGVGTIWIGKNMHTAAQLGFTVFTGAYPQSAWGTTVSWQYHDANNNLITGTAAPLGYNGIAYIAAPSFFLGNTTSVPNLGIEIQGVFSNSVAGKVDADPSQVLSDLLTNVKYGAGFPSARVGSLTTYQQYTLAAGLLVSPNYDTQRTVADAITELATATNSAPVWSSGQLTMMPYGDTSLAGNGQTYTPNLTPVYALTDSDFVAQPQSGGSLGGATGPVVMIRKRQSDKINSVKIEFLDRAANYAPGTAIANDQDLIDRFGIRTGGSQQLHLFCDATAANLSAQLQLRRQRISNTFQFELDARYILLDPMDLVTLTDAALGLSAQLVRITEIQENDSGTLSFTAEEVLTGTGQSPLYNFSAGLGYNHNADETAPNVNTPIIFEPPQALVNAPGSVNTGQAQLWVAVSANSTLWGGCNVYLSVDNVNFSLAAQIIGPSRMGVTSAALNPFTGTNPDTINTLSVDLTESAGTLLSGSATDALLGNTLCVVDDELVSFQTATLTATSKYNLTILYRGLYGTNVNGHASGVNFARLDKAVTKIVLGAQYVGQTLYIKLQSFNIYGGGLQSLASVTTYQYIPRGFGMLHPLGQLLSVNNADSGLIANTAATKEDYGFITAQIQTGTQFYFPVTVDLGTFTSAFSCQFVASSSTAMTLTRGAANGKTFSVAFWVKRATLGDLEVIWNSGTLNTVALSASLQFNAANQVVFVYPAAGLTLAATTTAVADTTTWHHVLLAVDTTQATAGNRVIVYVDGNLQTLSGSLPTQNSTLITGNFNLGTPQIGSDGNLATRVFYNGNMTEYYNISGQQLAPANFISGTPGLPIKFTGSFGSFDQYLNFSNRNNLGQDFSGNNTNYTLVNITVANQATDYP